MFPAEVEKALVGMSVGEQKTIPVPSADASVTAQVVDVKRRELPEVTAEFAKQAAGVTSVEELRETVRGRMDREAAARAERDYQQKVIDAVLAGATIDLPVSMVEHETDHLVADLAESLERRGMTLARYLEVAEKTEAQLRQELHPSAERRLRTQLAIEEVARLEALTPPQEEIDHEVEKVAQSLQQDLPRVREWLAQEGRFDALVGGLRRQKALTYLVTIARGDSP